MPREKTREDDVNMLWKKLQNPFALVAQGFLVGGVVFWTTQAEAASFVSALIL